MKHTFQTTEVTFKTSSILLVNAVNLHDQLKRIAKPAGGYIFHLQAKFQIVWILIQMTRFDHEN